jgi:arabinogalactan oligomer/maltooligosaccharide transport system permease protein
VAEGAGLPGAAEQFHGVFYDFLREGLWGLYTLGEEVPRDNSIFLLAEGIISVLIVALAC